MSFEVITNIDLVVVLINQNNTTRSGGVGYFVILLFRYSVFRVLQCPIGLWE